MKHTRLLAASLLSLTLLFLPACENFLPEGGTPVEDEPAETAKIEPPAEEPESAAEPKAETTAPEPETKASSKKSSSDQPVVVMETSKGTIRIELYKDKAPESVDNFLTYAKSGYYDGTIFHRVIPDFMIQGGGFTPDMEKKETRDPIQNEAKNGLKNERGTIAMARTFMPHSATSQFFINHVDNAKLDNSEDNEWGYAVFGKVVEGMDVIDAIATVPTKSVGQYQNVPAEPVVIKSVKLAS